MKLETIMKKAVNCGLSARIERMTGGGRGLFISLEEMRDGRARMVPREKERPLMAYLTRYKVKHEYRGNFISLFIEEV